jgi:hypothetical protein
LPGFRQQRRELRVKSDNVEQINGESRQLTETKPDVPWRARKKSGQTWMQIAQVTFRKKMAGNRTRMLRSWSRVTSA